MRVKTVFDYFGGGRGAKSRIAAELGISRVAVGKWFKRPDGRVPDGSAYSLVLKFPALGEEDRDSTTEPLLNGQGGAIGATACPSQRR